MIRTSNGEYEVAAAALDTQCQTGNWISRRLVEELGLVNSIRYDSEPAQVITATGQEVESCGIINLNWKLVPNENRVFRGNFFVLPGVRHLDVILGRDIINQENILSVNSRGLFAPLIAHKKLKKCEYHIRRVEDSMCILTIFSF